MTGEVVVQAVIPWHYLPTAFRETSQKYPLCDLRALGGSKLAPALKCTRPAGQVDSIPRCDYDSFNTL